MDRDAVTSRPRDLGVVAGGRDRRPRAPRPRRRRGPRRRGARPDDDPLRRQRPRHGGRTRPGRGLPSTMLPGPGIQRRLTLANLGAVIGRCERPSGRPARASPPARGRGRARRLRQRRLRPRRGAARRPLVVPEQNARAGAANRLLAASPPPARSPSRAPTSRKHVVTGNPLRPEIAAADGDPTATGPRGARPADRPRMIVRVRRLARARADQRGRARPGRALARPRRPRHPPRGRPARLDGLRGAGRAADAGGSCTGPVEYEDRMPAAPGGRRRAAAGRRCRRAGRRSGPACSCRSRSHRATTRPPTPRPWCRRGGASWCDDAELDGRPAGRRGRTILDDPAQRRDGGGHALGGADAADRVAPRRGACPPVADGDPSLDLSSRRGPRGRRRRCRHERHRHACSPPWATGVGQDLKESPVLERLRALGVDVHVGHDAGPSATSTPSRCPPPCPAQPRGPGRARAGHPGAAAGRDPGRHRRRPAARSRWPAPTARPPPRRCSPWSWSRPGCDPSFIVGGEVNEIGSGAVWADGDWSWSRPTRATAPSSSSAPTIAIVTNVEADHLDYYGDLAAVEAAFDRFLGGGPGPTWSCADDPGAAAGPATAPSPTAPTRADYVIVDR